MENSDRVIVERLQKRASQADEMIAVLRKQLVDVKKVLMTRAYADEANRLMAENHALQIEVNGLKNVLIKAEKNHGIQQISIPTSATSPDVQKPVVKLPVQDPVQHEKKDKPTNDLPKKSKGEAKSVKNTSDNKQEEREADVSRLDLKVGLILNAKKHPDADSLYVEEVDLCEGKIRTVVSGLVKHVPIDAMQNRLAVFLCNLKPAKMRGVLSEAMVMCASTPEKVEILVPPAGCVPGDKVTCEGYGGEPDKELNPKKKVFEKVAPDLKTDSKCIATYKGVAWTVPNKGIVTAPTLANVQIK